VKTLITKKSIIIASTAMLLALITIVSVNAFNTPGPITGFANVATAPVRAIASTVAQTFESIYAAIYRYEDLEHRYDMLAARYAQLVLDQYEAADLARENEMLRELLEFRDRHGGFDHEPASVRSRGGDNWSSSFTINRGYANSDVRAGMGVTTEYGFLIGVVSEAGATTSTVRTILDTTFSTSAFVGDATFDDADIETSISLTASGNFNFMRSGLLIIDYIDDGINLLPGASVITSGLGGVFPPALVIGEIEAIFPHANGIGRFATVRPMRDISTVNHVFVITGFELPED